MNLLMPGVLGVWLAIDQLIAWSRPSRTKPRRPPKADPKTGPETGPDMGE